MNNVYLIPTKKSKLVLNSKSELKLILDESLKNDSSKYVNVYITSDEEIKKGDWCYSEKFNNVRKVIANPANVNFSKGYNKVILTTDQDLIKDGVQELKGKSLRYLLKTSTNTVITKKEGENYEIVIPGEKSIKQVLSSKMKKIQENWEKLNIVSPEEQVLNNIKVALAQGNELLALDFIKQYGEWKKSN